MAKLFSVNVKGQEKKRYTAQLMTYATIDRPDLYIQNSKGKTIGYVEVKELIKLLDRIKAEDDVSDVRIW